MVEVDGASGNLLTIPATGSEEVKNSAEALVRVRVTDVNGEPVIGASVSLTGMGAAASGMTGADGNATLSFAADSITLRQNQNEGYLALEVVADGYNDYSAERALKIARVH